jgi:hypothetical protein
MSEKFEAQPKDLERVFNNHPEPPCLSLYQPTNRKHPDNLGDHIQFKHLVEKLGSLLAKRYPDQDADKLLKPFRDLADDARFWKDNLDGLAVLSAPGYFETFRLQRNVPEIAVVSDKFHTKPLLRILQSADRYQVLGLNRKEIRLFQGNRDSFDEIPLHASVSATIEDALGKEITEPHETVASYGKGAAGPAMHHGHGSKKDELDIDTKRFFQSVDKDILKFHSRPSGLPLVLAALPEQQSVFRSISHNPFLLEEGIMKHPSALKVRELQKLCWDVVGPRYLNRLSDLIEEFEEAKSKEHADEAPEKVAEAATAGRVKTALIEADKQIPGSIDLESGTVSYENLENPDTDDILDDIAQIVLRKGGEVVIVPTENMPTDTGVAATYRF